MINYPLGDHVERLMHVRLDHPQLNGATKLEFRLLPDEGYDDIDVDVALSFPLEIIDIKPRGDGADVIVIYLRAWGR